MFFTTAGSFFFEARSVVREFPRQILTYQCRAIARPTNDGRAIKEGSGKLRTFRTPLLWPLA